MTGFLTQQWVEPQGQNCWKSPFWLKLQNFLFQHAAKLWHNAKLNQLLHICAFIQEKKNVYWWISKFQRTNLSQANWKIKKFKSMEKFNLEWNLFQKSHSITNHTINHHKTCYDTWQKILHLKKVLCDKDLKCLWKTT